MNSYFNSIFTREHLESNGEIINWWNKGRKIMNIVFIVYSILHFLFIFIFLKNGFVFFLLPMIPILWVSINIVFSFGLAYELAAKRLFKSNVDFDKISPTIKACEFIIIGYSVLLLSIKNIMDLM